MWLLVTAPKTDAVDVFQDALSPPEHSLDPAAHGRGVWLAAHRGQMGSAWEVVLLEAREFNVSPVIKMGSATRSG